MTTYHADISIKGIMENTKENDNHNNIDSL